VKSGVESDVKKCAGVEERSDFSRFAADNHKVVGAQCIDGADSDTSA
jgi:hypothetical protein